MSISSVSTSRRPGDPGEAVEAVLQGDMARAACALEALGLANPASSAAALREVVRGGSPALRAPLAEAVLAELPGVADGDMALSNFARWLGHVASPESVARLVLSEPPFRAELLTVLAGSQFLADILARDPEAYSAVLPPVPIDEERLRRDALWAITSFPTTEARLNALRRLKRRVMFHLGWRDLTGRAEFTEVVRIISLLAETLIDATVCLVREQLAPRYPRETERIAFAIIGMGKLGAGELNYSSDVDLLFVTRGEVDPLEDPVYLKRLGEGIVAALGGQSAEGNLWRVDMRLRPEGRLGPLSRTLESYRDYYDGWAEGWERQALIKARPVGGDPELGRAFAAMIQPRVWRVVHAPTTLVDEVTDIRRAILERVRLAGELETNVKEGSGTIRDIEFSVQLLQLLFGLHRPELRAPDTCSALDALASADLLSAEERDALAEAYVFFRVLEHRLQLFNDQAVRCVPTDEPALTTLARRLGMETGAELRAAYDRHAGAVREITGTIFARLRGGAAASSPLRDLALRLDRAEGREALRRELERLGFPDAGPVVEVLVRLGTGAPSYDFTWSVRRLFADVLPDLVTDALATPDPATGIVEVERLAGRTGPHRLFYRSLAEDSERRRALLQAGAVAPVAVDWVARRPEWLEALLDPTLADAPDAPLLTSEALAAEIAERVRSCPPERHAETLARVKGRHFVRIAARDARATPSALVTGADLTTLAEGVLEGALATLSETERRRDREPEETRGGARSPDDRSTDPPIGGFVVLGLGRLGGGDLGYGSDLDVMLVYESGDPAPWTALAERLLAMLRAQTGAGVLYDIDLRLRPEGANGPVVASMETCRRYYAERAQTWERQSFLKARPVTGDRALGARLLRELADWRYPESCPASVVTDVRHMKRRIERERSRQPERDLKLGPGGISDIEFLAQLLQLQHAGRHPTLRVTGTAPALRALAAEGLLAVEETRELIAALDLLTQIRNRVTLRRGLASDLFPADAAEAAVIARSLGRADGPALLEELRERRARVRNLFRRGFLGEG